MSVSREYGVKSWKFSVEASWLIGTLPTSSLVTDSTVCHSSAAETMPPEVQEAEENFDLALIASLEIDVVPHLGDVRVPDHLIMQLAKVLHLGSKLREFDDASPPLTPPPLTTPPKKGSRTARSSDSFEKLDVTGDRNYTVGTTDSGTSLPRERFSYWCFDLLFLICSDTAKGVYHLSRTSLRSHRVLVRSRIISSESCYPLSSDVAQQV